jgi:hypothetical protein
MPRRYIAFAISCLIMTAMIAPFSVFAQGNLIPCDGEDCNFQMLMVLFNNVISFLLFTIATPFAAIVFAYAGWLYLRSGDNPGNKTKAKSMFFKMLIGYIVALGAYLIVKVIMEGLGFDASNFDAFY